jgi:intergrase/recombinase
MKNIPTVRLSPDMNLKQIVDEIQKLDVSKGKLHQKSIKENGVEVVYLRRATAMDSIKNLFMGSAKRKESSELAFKLISTKAEKIGLSESSSFMKNIKEQLNSGRGDMNNTLQQIGVCAEAYRISRL